MGATFFWKNGFILFDMFLAYTIDYWWNYHFTSAMYLGNVITVAAFGVDELPPPYTPTATGGIPMISCKVCHNMVNIEGKTHQHVVKCTKCDEATVRKIIRFYLFVFYIWTTFLDMFFFHLLSQSLIITEYVLCLNFLHMLVYITNLHLKIISH